VRSSADRQHHCMGRKRRAGCCGASPTVAVRATTRSYDPWPSGATREGRVLSPRAAAAASAAAARPSLPGLPSGGGSSATVSSVHGGRLRECSTVRHGLTAKAVMRARVRLLKRMSKVERDLAAIQRDGAVIKKHCTATAEEIQTAIKAHKREQHDAECLALGMEFVHKEQIKRAKAKLRRLMS
jgi:hypothetical protein